jgi:hypothetical protein
MVSKKETSAFEKKWIGVRSHKLMFLLNNINGQNMINVLKLSVIFNDFGCSAEVINRQFTFNVEYLFWENDIGIYEGENQTFAYSIVALFRVLYEIFISAIRRSIMLDDHFQETLSSKKDQIFYKGQSIIYHGETARILSVRPVLIIKIKDKPQVICGNHLLNDVSPYKN